ncbi:deoxycytidine triphosphate deaminase [Deinococcus proteolyticus MRP]|uniref:Deoxycytidine triphosphate deaminase n=1 Tax=Deinococcus proteolyticus (strain ATCC 35074 / DSM 20540 / JCM 6276 / NBRC 101906 / NCIMB 13154 / VKM Ac-1939 / CCM 2703 / MRP) TaxID=693977 RepID=F0RP55_DEIPM|nr:dCTP deaminase [Deinococcus proteolyticus]ADY25370.1 deoxycytidine triphosphate deaminase [Deinococcus proteolyticus MRP]
MSIVTHKNLSGAINKGIDSVLIDPLLDESQIGNISVDLRLGYDFLVSIKTRSSYISLDKHGNYRSTTSYFQNTRRDVGDGFLVYPGQLVLTTSLEYVKLPGNIYAEIITRSSYNRLGIRLSTTLQPGFRGCVPIEIANDSNNPVELIIGSRLIQMKLYSIDEDLDYGSSSRKYYGDTSPNSSRASEDYEIALLASMSKKSKIL